MQNVDIVFINVNIPSNLFRIKEKRKPVNIVNIFLRFGSDGDNVNYIEVMEVLDDKMVKI